MCVCVFAIVSLAKLLYTQFESPFRSEYMSEWVCDFVVIAAAELNEWRNSNRNNIRRNKTKQKLTHTHAHKHGCQAKIRKCEFKLFVFFSMSSNNSILAIVLFSVAMIRRNLPIYPGKEWTILKFLFCEWKNSFYLNFFLKKPHHIF